MNYGQFKTFNITILVKTDKITVFLNLFLLIYTICLSVLTLSSYTSEGSEC